MVLKEVCLRLADTFFELFASKVELSGLRNVYFLNCIDFSTELVSYGTVFPCNNSNESIIFINLFYYVFP